MAHSVSEPVTVKPAWQRWPPVRLVRRASDRMENFWITVILVGIVIGFWLWAPPNTFLTGRNILNIALDASELMILSAGVALLIIAGGLDLSVGAVIVFAAVMSAKALAATVGAGDQPGQYSSLGLGILVGILVAVGSGVMWGSINAFVVLRMRVPHIIATLGTLSIAYGLASIVTGGYNVSRGVPPVLQEEFGGGRAFGVIPWLVVIAAVITAILWVVLAWTRFGLRTYAIGGSRAAAERAGVPVVRHLATLYILVGTLAGIVAFLDISRFGTASLAGHTQDALNAIAAVVIGGVSLFGGRGRMSGVIVGVFIPAVLANGFIVVGVDAFWQNVAVGAVLILAVFIDQQRRLARGTGQA
jgi:ribose transport system permease protein